MPTSDCRYRRADGPTGRTRSSRLLVSGDVTYSPAPLEAPSDIHVLVCCARPSTEVVVDL